MLRGAADSDHRLLLRARGGDEHAFERLYERYRPRIFAFCRHLTGHHEDAEDAVQYTFLVAYRAIVQSNQRLDLRPWLFTVARNRCRSLLRARRVRTLGERMEAPHVSEDSLAEQLQQREELRSLVHDLQRLPENQRAALLLSELAALSHRDVAAVLGVPTSKVKALVFQARSSLTSTREARDVACEDIRSQLATLSGSALRRRQLRRHVRECSGCRAFEAALAEQRRGIAALLPVASGAGRHASSALTAAQGGGGATATSLAASGGLVGSITAPVLSIGIQGALKAVLAIAAVGGGAAGAASADLPTRLGLVGAASGRSESADRRSVALNGHRGSGAVALVPTRSGAGERGPALGRDSGTAPAGRDPVPAAAAGSGPAASTDPAKPPAGAGRREGPAQPAGQAGLPPGIARRDALPPGLAKRDGVAPGKGSRGRASKGAKAGAPRPGGNAGRRRNAGANADGHGGGHGNAGANGNGGEAHGNAGGNGAGQGNGGAPGKGDGAGQGNGGGNGNGGANGNAGANGNGNAGVNGNGSAGGKGNGAGEASAPGNGGGNATAGGNGSGAPAGPGNGNAGSPSGAGGPSAGGKASGGSGQP